jgi:hypothetical protein
VELQASESVLGSWLSGDEQRFSEAAGDRVRPAQPTVRRGAEKSGVVAGESARLVQPICPEKRRGSLVLLLVMGRWIVMLCRTLGRIPLLYWLHCAEGLVS